MKLADTGYQEHTSDMQRDVGWAGLSVCATLEAENSDHDRHDYRENQDRTSHRAGDGCACAHGDVALPFVPNDVAPKALLNLEEYRRFDPEIFEPVEFSLFASQEVNDHIAVVHQDPSTFNLALDAVWANSPFPHLAHDFALQCAQLSDVVGGRNDKHICKRGQFTDVE